MWCVGVDFDVEFGVVGGVVVVVIGFYVVMSGCVGGVWYVFNGYDFCRVGGIEMKCGFVCLILEKFLVIKFENIVLLILLSILLLEGKFWWLIVVGVVVVGLLGGMVVMVFVSGLYVFGGIGLIFLFFMMVGIMMMMFCGMGGG